MKKHINFLIKSVIFLGILCCFLYQVYQIIMPKFFFDNTWPTTSTYIGFYEMEKNTVDVLFLGSSHAASSFIPQELYNNYGITSYNLGCEQQNLITSYYWLKEALRFQQPKAVVLDCHFLFPYNVEEALNSAESCTRKALDYMKWSSVKREAVKTICALDEKQSIMSYYFPNVRYHTRWKGLEENDFSYAKRAQHFELKGYAPLSYFGGQENFSPLEVNASQKEGEMVSLMQQYLEKITALCEQEGISLVLVKIPAIQQTIARYHSIEKYAKSHNILFFDFNEKSLFEEINYHFHQDNQDNEHGNLWGAQKITNYVGAVLSENLIIEKKVNASWEDTKSYYEQIQKDCELPHISDIDTYLTALKEGSYCIFIAAKDECTANLKDTTMQKLKELGLKTDLQGKYRYSYLAVITEQGIEEQIGEEKIQYSASIRNALVPFDIESAGFTCGNTSSIKLNGREYSKNYRGLNIVVYNYETLKIVDTVCFDTFSEENSAVR